MGTQTGDTNKFIRKQVEKMKEINHGQNQINKLNSKIGHNKATQFIVFKYLALHCCSKILHDHSGGWLITTDAFDLSESSVSNAIYTQGLCLNT